jgi:ATP-dependent DNA helicase PIF1
MPLLDYVSLFLSSLVALLLCCMLVALGRFSASLRFSPPKASSRLPSQLRAATFGTASPSPRTLGRLSIRPLSTAAMFQQALQTHNAGMPSQTPIATKQQSLATTFNRPSAASKPSGARPLSTLSGNTSKHNVAHERRLTGQAHGIKRTSSGLAKALGSQEDAFDYPSLNISDYENDVHSSFHNNNNAGKSAPQNPVFFDADDFDSDIDLDVEDPATKATVRYPTLPSLATGRSRDSAYSSATPQPASVKNEPNSSAPIPWSSSPPEHFEPMATARKPPEPTKRRTLPWLQKTSQTAVREEPEPESSRPSKRRSTEATSAVKATPVKKEIKSEYPWNTTQSALKLQQKNLRDAHKAIKATEANDEDVKEAIRKKKKNTVHRIFLSEEQQHVLNLVVEYKKSVFFTGSAGKWLTFVFTTSG